MKREEKVNELMKKFAAEIAEAKGNGCNYAEADDDCIHFCTVVNGSTPMNWSRGPECDQFWID